MDIASRPILGFLSDPLNRCPRRFSLADEGISVRGGAKSWIGFEEIASRPSAKSGMLSSSLAIELPDGVRVVLPAVRAAAAGSFAEAAGDAWSEFNHRVLLKEEGLIRNRSIATAAYAA